MSANLRLSLRLTQPWDRATLGYPFNGIKNVVQNEVGHCYIFLDLHRRGFTFGARSGHATL